MRLLIGIDDTDVLGAPIGTGRLARMFEKKLPDHVRLWGVLRHQLLVDARIPYTSHNSPACIAVDLEDEELIPELIQRVRDHIRLLASPGSDPGLCVARADLCTPAVITFGLACTQNLVTQDEARTLAAESGLLLEGLGGTEDGVIGALAAVGLTAYGWCGRFLEFNGLRDLPDPVRVDALIAHGLLPVALDQDASVPPSQALIETNGWLSPRLWGGRPIVPVSLEDGQWKALGKKARDAEVAE
ncbi:hypothetical protein [Beijerinckia indica]|uniref:Conserved hypothetical cytosolic protein n=1 Tax=Beijerinckia indica subsp. indica (strain ATCC 9039 / DSM 1715 / NCIMB 8712) TaxID=395963 RepID=B2IFV7_BEII9|nr:hypothetical protein [Beijerinckia indica]ACB95696.1 conserved hypothetical cytosolic protein [Beijerinckia indica subsp. indica ATCC 9039]